METIPFALSVHHFISSVGADAGFAAFIAVALLVLLFFSQARETANLRRRADEAGERVQELEGQLYVLSEQVAALPAEISVVRAPGKRPAPAYGGVPAPAPAGVGAPASTLPPAAPAGVGAPALAAATRLIPDPVRPLGEHQPATVGLVDGPADEATEVHSAPVTVSGGNGSSHRPIPASAATFQRSVQSRPGGPRDGGGPPRGAQGRPVGAQGRPGGPPRSAMAVRPGQRRAGPARLFVVLAVLLGVGAVVAGVIVIRNVNHATSQSKSSAADARSTVAGHRTGPVAAVNPVTVTVSVLNGTPTSGLARTVSSKLAAAGYQKGLVGNYTPDQTQTSTAVQYIRGYKRDAAAVATALKLRPAAVQPIGQSTQQIACPPSSGPCKSAVVVTVGSDLANLATQ
jgi:LytR cell envelope-related transcriptional attenuator